MIKELRKLKEDPLIKEAYESSRAGPPLYLVGGVLRNLALKKPPAPDYDFVLAGDVKGFSDALAERLGGTSFLLDKEAPSCRIALKRGGGAVTLDFSPVKDNDIIHDLETRDFTVNAMAVELESLFAEKTPRVIDPCRGRADAGKGVLRMVSKGAFDEDPLRCLRAVRLAQQYDLRIARATLDQIKMKSGLLKRTSAERIREELVYIFQSPGTPGGVKLLFDTGIIDFILPEIKGWGDVQGYNLLAHSLKTLEEAERLLAGISEMTFPGVSGRLKGHFSGSVGSLKKEALFKLSAFFHDVGKPLAISREEGKLRFIGHDFEGSRIIKDVLRRLKFSRGAVTELSNIIRNHHRVFMLAGLKERTVRAKGHLFRAAGGEAGIDLLCLALADARATRGGEDEELYSLVKEMLAFYYEVYTRKKPKPLLNGKEIMRTFGIPQGRLVGEIINKISEGVEAGVVRNKKDAVRHVREWLKGRKTDDIA